MNKLKPVFILLLAYFVFACKLPAQSGTWVWVSGIDSSSIMGNYDSLFGNYGDTSIGVPSQNIYPPEMWNETGIRWQDKEGNLWLYGGVQHPNNGLFSNDMWEYNTITNEWTIWEIGSGLAIYGTKGVPSPNISPGPRLWGCATWVDTAGDFWLFGGETYITANSQVPVSDLWRYHPASNEWTWVAGKSGGIYPPVTGVYQQPSDSALPAVRESCISTWTDCNNNLWFFGGYADSRVGLDGGLHVANDLWRFNISSNEWAWMGGHPLDSSSGNYGQLGIEDSANQPASRLCSTYWVDSNYLYLWGGATFPNPSTYSGTYFYYDDIWRFDLKTNMWAWISGPQGYITKGVYNSYCQADGINAPPGLFAQSAVQMPGCSQVIMMFGGTQYTNYEYYATNDIWSLDKRTLKWCWLSGSDTFNFSGNFGIKQVADSTNSPPALYNTCLWGDKNGNLWMWGGAGAFRYNNAMWKYTPDYACLGTVSQGNFTYNITSSSVCSSDSTLLTVNGSTGITVSPDSLVTFIDSTHAYLKPHTTTAFIVNAYSACGNYNPDTIIIPVLSDSLNVSANSTNLCPGDTAFICADTGFTNYLWSTGQTTSCISVDKAAAYSVQATGNNGCQASSIPINISYYTSPPISIAQSGDTLYVYNAFSVQWYLNDTLITGATDSVYVTSKSGNYTVQITDTNGCKAFSSPILISGINDESAANYITVFPNPTSTGWKLQFSGAWLGSKATMFDASGRNVFESIITNQNTLIEIPVLAKGIYELRVISGNLEFRKKLVKE